MNPRILAIKMHGKQLYSDGHPYIEHLDRVAAHFPPNSAAHDIAILHDILEDTPCTEEMLRETYTTLVVDAVVLLTKVDKVSGDEYYARIKANQYARMVKLADLSDNMAHCLLNILNDVPPKNKRGWLEMANTYAKRIHYLTT